MGSSRYNQPRRKFLNNFVENGKNSKILDENGFKGFSIYRFHRNLQ